MSGTLVVTRVAACSATFESRHHLPSPSTGSKLEIGSDVGDGGFATLHRVDAIAGQAPALPLVAKLFRNDVLASLPGGRQQVAKGIDRLIRRLEQLPDAGWCDHILALPYYIAYGDWKGSETLVALMIDLRARGYETCPFANAVELQRYLSRTDEERQDLAGAFAEKAALFERIGLVHADLNGENMMIRYSPPDVQIIDVDGGVLVERGDERPLTAGKADALMPPEIKRPTSGAQVDMAAYVPEAERWSVGCLVGYFLFGAHPAFFLKEISRDSITRYARGPAWPTIDPRSNLFTDVAENRRAYPAMRRTFDAAPAEIRDAFRRLFAAGLDAKARPSAEKWVDALASMLAPPEFINIEATPSCGFADSEVHLTWRAKRAGSVTIDCVDRDGRRTQLGSFAETGSVLVTVKIDSCFELSARNSYGETTARSNPVRVLRAVAIATARLPRPKLGSLPAAMSILPPAQQIVALELRPQLSHQPSRRRFSATVAPRRALPTPVLRRV